MNIVATDTHVQRLERAMADLAEAQARTERNLELLHVEVRATGEQVARVSADLRAISERTSADLRAYQDENRVEFLKMRRHWGELANKMGTLVEDLVAPGLPEILREQFGIARLDMVAQRVRRVHQTDPGRTREFDFVAVAGDLVVINETKSQVRPEDVPAFVQALEEVRAFLSEAAGRQVIGCLATFSIDPSLVTAGERRGLLMLGLGTGLLTVLNTPGFVPRRF